MWMTTVLTAPRRKCVALDRRVCCIRRIGRRGLASAVIRARYLFRRIRRSD